MKDIGTLACAETGAIVCRQTELADTYWTRLRGLQFRRSLDNGQGLLIVPCHSIHTACMRFAIDAVFLSKTGGVLEVRSGVKPWSVAACRGAKAVLELPAGAAKMIDVGTKLQLKSKSSRRSVTFLGAANPAD